MTVMMAYPVDGKVRLWTTEPVRVPLRSSFGRGPSRVRPAA